MNFDLAIEKAAQIHFYLLPADAKGLRWLYQKAGTWSDPSTPEFTRREVASRIFSLATIPCALIYSAYFLARAVFQFGTCLLNHKVKKAFYVLWEDISNALKCVILAVSNVAYCLFGFYNGNTLYKSFVPPPLQVVQKKELIQSTNAMKKNLEAKQLEVEQINEKIHALNEQKNALEKDILEYHECKEKSALDFEHMKTALEKCEAQIKEKEHQIYSLHEKETLTKQMDIQYRLIQRMEKENEENNSKVSITLKQLDLLQKENLSLSKFLEEKELEIKITRDEINLLQEKLSNADGIFYDAEQDEQGEQGEEVSIINS